MNSLGINHSCDWPHKAQPSHLSRRCVCASGTASDMIPCIVTTPPHKCRRLLGTATGACCATIRTLAGLSTQRLDASRFVAERSHTAFRCRLNSGSLLRQKKYGLRFWLVGEFYWGNLGKRLGNPTDSPPSRSPRIQSAVVALCQGYDHPADSPTRVDRRSDFSAAARFEPSLHTSQKPSLIQMISTRFAPPLLFAIVIHF